MTGGTAIKNSEVQAFRFGPSTLSLDLITNESPKLTVPALPFLLDHHTKGAQRPTFSQGAERRGGKESPQKKFK